MKKKKKKDPICTWCEEPVTKDDERAPIINEVWHRECGIRAIVGTMAHIQGRCSCFAPFNDPEEEDPPGMTRREAARAAAKAADELAEKMSRMSPGGVC